MINGIDVRNENHGILRMASANSQGENYKRKVSKEWRTHELRAKSIVFLFLIFFGLVRLTFPNFVFRQVSSERSPRS
ncbi:hypothetical protein E2C01_033653 [Portunus trituberculatus]|uniref:Uncharacterized protein n=1 Tax=Portunus trituberculatus TaxID=210409 RepID=A0A5B7EYG7_PORTR|nr:hypothetical protein [Portunus trituberculatus]